METYSELCKKPKKASVHADQNINLFWLVRLDIKMYRFSSLMVTIDIGRPGLRDPCAPKARLMPRKVS